MNKFWKLLRRLLLLLIVVATLFIGLIFSVGYFQYQDLINDTSIEEKVLVIQSRDDYVEVSDIADEFIESVVAVEDRRFYQRTGLDYISIGRSIITNVQEGALVQGASTIPQQVAKLLYFDYQNDLMDKVVQVYLMNDIEKLYEKDEILEIYVNCVYYGDGYTGVGSASIGYYGINPSELTYSNGSLLAGIIQAPSAYALSEHYDLAKQRQVQVLNSLVREEILSEDEARSIHQMEVEIVY